MSRLFERYDKRRNPAANPDNYTFVSQSGDPADLVPIQAVKGVSVLDPYLNGMDDRMPQRITVPQPATRQVASEKPAISTTPPPVVDTSNAIASLAGLLGPTPAEREAREMRMERGRRQMQMWGGLFDGLRHLGNLYYTTKSATPQRYSDPYVQIDKNYQDARKLADDLDDYQRIYTQQLWNLRRQADDDARRNKLADAQAQYYGTRDEMARLKAENDRLKNEAAIRNYDARTKNYDAKTATEDALRGDRVREIVSRINKNNQTGAAAVIRANKTGAGRGRSSGSGRSGNDPYEELADHLQQNPDVVGPILQEEGMGYYDTENKKFTFTKNATKGMATTANKRTRQQVAGKKQNKNTQTKNGSSGTSNGKKKVIW